MEEPKKTNEDKSNWFLGVFYYNPGDKRLFPPKRIPAMGWTVNFANPLSILAMVVLIAVIWWISDQLF